MVDLYKNLYRIIAAGAMWLIVFTASGQTESAVPESLFDPNVTRSFQKVNNKYILVDPFERVISEQRYDHVSRFRQTDRLAFVTQGDRWFFIDTEGEMAKSFNLKSFPSSEFNRNGESFMAMVWIDSTLLGIDLHHVLFEIPMPNLSQIKFIGDNLFAVRGDHESIRRKWALLNH